MTIPAPLPPHNHPPNTFRHLVQVAGAAAAEGLPLADVKAAAAAALEHIGTMGVALGGCNVPGSAPSDRCGALRF